MSERSSGHPDMSPAAIDRRLRDVSDLLDLCRALQRGTLRPLEDGTARPQDECSNGRPRSASAPSAAKSPR